MVFKREIQSASAKLADELKGDQIAGTYESTTAEGVKKGKRNVTRKRRMLGITSETRERRYCDR
jgi:hypothetical protein